MTGEVRLLGRSLWLWLGVCGISACSTSPRQQPNQGALLPNPEEDVEECSNAFACDEDKACTDCDCPCEGLIELWSTSLPTELRAVAEGPNEGTYLLLSSAPWIARVARDGTYEALPQYDLAWTSERSAALGVRGTDLIVVGTVAPMGEDEVHIERIAEDGTVQFSDTLDVSETDQVYAGRMESDGSFTVIGSRFVGSFKEDDSFDHQVRASLWGSAFLGRKSALAGRGNIIARVSLLDGMTVERSVTHPFNGVCTFALGVDDGAYEMCAHVSAATEVAVSELDANLERAWTANYSSWASRVTPTIAVVNDGVLLGMDGDHSIQRYNRAAEVVAEVDFYQTYLLALTSTDVLALGSNLRSVSRWYAPPIRDQIQAAGEACTSGAQCSSGTCCKPDATTPGTCAGDEGCAARSVCSDSSECAGLCETELGTSGEARCRATCSDDDECADGEKCAHLPCRDGVSSCPALCATDCLALGAEACAAGEACFLSPDKRETFVCGPACLNVECGEHKGTTCGSCAADASCEDNICVEIDEALTPTPTQAPSDPVEPETEPEPECPYLACGTSRGYDCGDCFPDEICDDGYCYFDPCAYAECGDQNGVFCGGCFTGEACVEGLCIEQNVETPVEDPTDEEPTDSPTETTETSSEDIDAGPSVDTTDDTTSVDTTDDTTSVDPCLNVECGVVDGEQCGDCSNTEYCNAGVCSPRTSCEDGQVIDVATGDVLDTCPKWSNCLQSGFEAECVDMMCRATMPACVNDVYGTCNALGSGLDDTGGMTICAAGYDCSVIGCVDDLLVDQLGPLGDTVDLSGFDSFLVGNFYEATAKVSLAEWRPYFGLTEEYELTWVVYQSETLEGPYQFVRAYTVEGPSDSGFLRYPGPSSALFEAGHYYFIGVQSTVPQVNITAYESAPDASRALSFGTVLGGYIGEPPIELTIDLMGDFALVQELVTVPLQ